MKLRDKLENQENVEKKAIKDWIKYIQKEMVYKKYENQIPYFEAYKEFLENKLE